VNEFECTSVITIWFSDHGMMGLINVWFT